MAATICFNSQCLTSQSDRWRNGWLLRNSDFALLCDRCGSIYEEGRFCEIFHKDASGWRSCETCGKQVHCGCIVSVHAFSVLDAGGIDCAACARKSSNLTSNLRWPLQSSPGLTECFNKSCNSTSGSSFPEGTQQMMDIYSRNNKISTNCNLESLSYHADDFSTMNERPFWSNQLASLPSERDECQDLCLCGEKSNESEKIQSGKSGFSCEEVYSYHDNSVDLSIPKDRHSSLHLGLNFGQWPSQAENQLEVYDAHPPVLRSQNVATHQLDAFDGSVSSHQTQEQMIDVHHEKESLSSYKPNMPGNELQGSANSVITPLFEKLLTVTDARRVERLVLPKKCVESYFPRISHPNGSRLKFHDTEGNVWTFKFRFWLNANGHRQYFLEGMTPCIQSWQLQAGDVVTFSRIEPGRKLMMGFRKAANGPQLTQDTQVVENGHEVPSVQDINCDRHKPNEAKEAFGASSNVPWLRQYVSLSPKRKHSWISSYVDSSELFITLEEAQALFRSPPDHSSNVEIIGDFQFEEFEDAPVIGRPTIFTRDSVGNEVRWDQCDDCLKWRKLPFNCILPARWTCAENFWDSDRSTCDAAQELSIEELIAASKKLLDAPPDLHSEVHQISSSALDETYHNSAQLRTEQNTSHSPSCSCVVCVKPLSGKNSQHEPGCTCKVCLYIRKQIQSVIHKEKSTQSEIEAETLKSTVRDRLYKRVRRIVCQMGNQSSQLETQGGNIQSSGISTPIISSSRGCVGPNEKVVCNSLEGEIDLNMKPNTDDADSICCRDVAQIMSHRHSNYDGSMSESLAYDKHRLDVNHKNNRSVAEHSLVMHLSSSVPSSRIPDLMFKCS